VPNRIFFIVAFVVAVAVVSLALVWPQGMGARSPGPFGGPTTAQTAKPVPRAAPVTRNLL